MPVQTDRFEFTPPPQRGLVRGFGLALLAHALLLVGLTWGLHWKRDAEDVAVEAELWSSVVQQAAPKLVETPPPPPQPTPRVAPPPPTPQVKDADIALERDRKKREADKKEREQRELEKKQQAEKAEKAEKAARDKKAAAEKLAADKRKNDDAQNREDQQAKAAAEKRRLDNIRRMQGMAGASGSEDATGNALRSSGPSASYGARLASLFKRNITFDPGTITGNPKAIVEVRVGPSGLIISSRLTKSSGVPAWDEAVLRAVQKTDRIPADENGRYPSVFPAEFGPRD